MPPLRLGHSLCGALPIQFLRDAVDAYRRFSPKLYARYIFDITRPTVDYPMVGLFALSTAPGRVRGRSDSSAVAMIRVSFARVGCAYCVEW